MKYERKYDREMYLDFAGFVLEQISDCEVSYQIREEEAMPDYTGVLQEVLTIVNGYSIDIESFKWALADALDCYWCKDIILSYLVSNDALLEDSFTQFSILENYSEMFEDDVENLAPDVDLFNLIVESSVTFNDLIYYCSIFEDYFEELDVYEHEDELLDLISECGKWNPTGLEERLEAVTYVRSVLESCKYK